MHTPEKTAMQKTQNDPARSLGQMGAKAKGKAPTKAQVGKALGQLAADAKAISHAKPSKATLPPAVISEVHLIELARIEVREQVRTIFEDGSIAELAQDIEARGLLQPVIVSPCGDEKYRLVCGERRLRAIQLLKHKAIPCLITRMSETEILLVQLSENIQREQMELIDEAKALRELYIASDEDLEATARRVNKSKAWVGKRLAMTMQGYSYRALKLVQDGITTDVEILNAVDQAYKIGWREEDEMVKAIQQGAGREEVRQLLKGMKAAQEAAKAASQAEKKDKAKAPPAPPPFKPELEVHYRIPSKIEQGEKAGSVWIGYSLEQRKEMEAILADAYVRGKDGTASGDAMKWIAKHADRIHNSVELVAFMFGLLQWEYDPVSILSKFEGEQA